MFGQNVQLWWGVEIDPKELMATNIAPRKVPKASSLLINIGVKQETIRANLERKYQVRNKEKKRRLWAERREP